MPREPLPIKREKKGQISIHISDIFKCPKAQKQVIKELKNLTLLKINKTNA